MLCGLKICQIDKEKEVLFKSKKKTSQAKWQKYKLKLREKRELPRKANIDLPHF